MRSSNQSRSSTHCPERPGGSSRSRQWLPNAGSGATASHAYNTAGSYTVTLTITDACGYSDNLVQANAVTVTTTRVRIYLPLVIKNH